MEKELNIKINKDLYQRIYTIVEWKNARNRLTNKLGKYSIEDFLRGAALSKVDDIEALIPMTSNLQERIGKELNIKNNFKQLAKEDNLKQAEIVRHLGIHKSNLSLIFNNKAQPTTETFFRLWLLLGCPPIHKCFQVED